MRNRMIQSCMGMGDAGTRGRGDGGTGRYADRFSASPRHPRLRVSLVGFQLCDRLRHIGDLRKDGVFELRGIGNKGIERTNTLYGSIEVLEKLGRDARGNLGPV